MNTPIVEYEGDQLEIDFNLDLPEFSICPNCAVEIIKLADGCSVCGWSNEKVLLGGDENCSSKTSSILDNKLAIPCLIKQPKNGSRYPLGQPEVKGVIKKDLGDRFVVYVPDSDSMVAVSKLLVYPDFSKSVGQINISPSKNLSPSNFSQKRRRKGSGSGSIYERTVIRNNKEYQQSYYHYKLNGKKGTFYIPQRLLGLIKEAESSKLPVIEVLKLLGEKQISPSKSSDTLTDKQERVNDEAVELREINPSNELSPSKKDLANEETLELLGDKKINPSKNSITFADEQITVSNEVIETRVINPSSDLSPSNSDEESEATSRLLGDNHIRPSKSFDTSTREQNLIDDLAIAISGIDPSNNFSPSKRQRSRGKGSGSVHYRTIKKKHKEYKQAYYHYEIWQKGDRLVKSSKYIPKKMEAKIMRMNNEKVSVEEILKVLRDRSKRKK